jgi:two-component system CheB/CheR fusion protein
MRLKDTESNADALDGLQHELQETRERLQSIIEEYETSLEELKSSNEELVSLNEELQSTNEEHETSKEELQSVNEELRTVNTELNDSIDDLDKANNDLRHLFESTNIATVFLDQNLNIRAFTPAISELFNVIPGDSGRPLTDITSPLALEELRREIEQVWQTGEPVERSVSTTDRSAHYLMRVLPYRGSNQATQGVVVTFVNVTPLVEAESHHRTLIEELNHRVKNMLTVVTALANQTMRAYPEPEQFRSVFTGRIEALAKIYELISRDHWRWVELSELVEAGVQPFNVRPGSVEIDGPAVALTPKAALALGLVVHELATNAVKYGALSVSAGRTSISWAVEEAGDEGFLVIRWHESGGPAVAKPSRKGFGTVLIERELKHQLRGKAAMRFAEDGLLATFRIPRVAELILSPPG